MKKVKKTYSKDYPVLRLYKDDLEEIVGIFKSHFTEIEIVADEYELTELADIDNIKKPKITHFKVDHYHHYDQEKPTRSELLRLELTHYRARLYLSNNADTYLLGVASQLDALLSKKKSSLGFLTSIRAIQISLAIYIPLYIILFIMGLSNRFAQSILPPSLLIIISIIGVCWTIFLSQIKTKNYCVISLINSNTKN